MATQNLKDQLWKDENGTSIPTSRLTKAEKLQERKAAALLKSAVAVNNSLKGFKEQIKTICEEVEDAVLSENGAKRSDDYKGTYTWFNFDRSIKVERKVSEPMTFDDLIITAAKQKLDEFLGQTISSKHEFVNEMINSAFETTKGKLDPKKVMPLLRYESKVNHPLFTEACRLINKAQRRPDSKTYYRVWAKNDDGKFEAVELNFSNI